MKRIKHLFESIVGLLLPIPAILIASTIEIIETWDPYLVFFKSAFILILTAIKITLGLLAIILVIDGIYGLITKESLIPKIKESLENLE